MLLVKARNVARKRSIVRKESSFLSVLPSIEEHALGLYHQISRIWKQLNLAESMTSFPRLYSLLAYPGPPSGVLLGSSVIALTEC